MSKAIFEKRILVGFILFIKTERHKSIPTTTMNPTNRRRVAALGITEKTWVKYNHQTDDCLNCI